MEQFRPRRSYRAVAAEAVQAVLRDGGDNATVAPEKPRPVVDQC
ncbi:hypothetical protein [Nocardia carnea]|nr:hypothetical protein [Nocardia carnea]